MASPILPTDAPSAFDVLSTLSSLERGAIVRPSNPPPGIAGFVVDVPEEERISLRSAISKHFVEDNTVLVDQIALEPEEFTLRGIVAEVVAFAPKPGAVATVPNPLPDNPNLSPALAPQAEQTAAAANATSAAQKSGATGSSSMWDFFLNTAPQPPSQTRQARAVSYLYALWRSRQLFTIETPWGFIVDVAILNVEATQGEETKGESTASVTFQKVRTAGASSISAGQLAGRASLQMSTVENNGAAGQTPKTEAQRSSLLYQFLRGGGP